MEIHENIHSISVFWQTVFKTVDITHMLWIVGSQLENQEL